MQAIITKFVPPTNTKPSRYKAACARGSITVSADYSLNPDGNHDRVARLLIAKFLAEDAAEAKANGNKYGYDPKRNPWAKPFVTGQIPSGAYVHVFTA